ncbi:MAG: hypothetical protein K8T90_18005 [Planctomycetes bacterium]|nr:hypothetical protein [Planctomycetota bacterium]
MFRKLRSFVRIASLALVAALFVHGAPARAAQAVDPSIIPPSNLFAQIQDDGYGGKDILISWYWNTANYNPKYGGYYIEGRDDTAGGQFRWMTGAGTVYSQSVTRGIITTPGVEPGPNDFIPGHDYTLRCYIDAGDGLDAYGLALTRSGYSNETTVAIPGIPKPPDGPTGLSIYVKSKGRKVILYWNDNSSDETGFRIERKDPGGAWKTLTTVAANKETWSDTSMGAVGNYTWRVVGEKPDSVETDPSNERTAWAGKTQTKCAAPAYDPPLAGTWKALDGTTLEIVLSGGKLTGWLTTSVDTYTVVLKGKPTATHANGVASKTGVFSVPVRVTLDTSAAITRAYRSAKFEVRKTVAGVTFPDPTQMRDMTRQEADSGEICVRSGAGLNSVKPGKTVVVVLMFTNVGRRGVPSDDVFGFIGTKGGTLLATHAGKGVTLGQTNDHVVGYFLPALGPAKLPASGTVAITVQVVATAGAEEVELEWTIASAEGYATFAASGGTVTVPIE